MGLHNARPAGLDFDGIGQKPLPSSSPTNSGEKLQLPRNTASQSDLNTLALPMLCIPAAFYPLQGICGFRRFSCSRTSCAFLMFSCASRSSSCSNRCRSRSATLLPTSLAAHTSRTQTRTASSRIAMALIVHCPRRCRTHRRNRHAAMRTGAVKSFVSLSYPMLLPKASRRP